jgi:hypothetical protein
MIKRRVIFPGDDYWTKRKDNTMPKDPKQDAIRNAPEATFPPDVIRTYAEGVRVMVSPGPERSLVMSLHFTMPAPLGDVEVYLGREQTLELHDHLVDLLALNDEQTEVLVARLHNEI